jgi:carbon-monoxide dehydrogenase medium subunit
VDVAGALLGELGPDAKVLAGGQSLVPLLSFRLVRPTALVDLNRITSLDYVRWEGEVVRIGALARHRTLELDDHLRRRCPMIAEALALVGHVAIRNRGTVAGSMAHADPAAEWPTLAVTLDAEFDIAGPRGTRVATAADFFVGFMTSGLQPDEIITEVRLVLPDHAEASSFQEFARRHGDYAMVGLAACARGDGKGLADVRLCYFGVGATPVRAKKAEAALAGGKLDEAVKALSGDLDPSGDVQATGATKKHLAGVLLKRVAKQLMEARP